MVNCETFTKGKQSVEEGQILLRKQAWLQDQQDISQDLFLYNSPRYAFFDGWDV